MTDADHTQTDDDLALDFVLGVLAEPELSLARDYEATNTAFAALVACHRHRLYPDENTSMVDLEAEHAEGPCGTTWDAIAVRISQAEDF